MDNNPFLILIAMAVPASKTLVKIYDDEAGDINIQVTGYQWKWQYRYLEDGVSFFANLSTDLDEIYNLSSKRRKLSCKKLMKWLLYLLVKKLDS